MGDGTLFRTNTRVPKHGRWNPVFRMNVRVPEHWDWNPFWNKYVSSVTLELEPSVQDDYVSSKIWTIESCV